MSKKIIVIDDESAIRKSFELALEDSGYRVDTASSGREGLEMLQGEPYDLVFLDLKMPGLTGVETLRELRKRDQNIPVYIVTAFYGEFVDELSTMAEGGTDFEVLNKPVDGDTIFKVCQGV
ncbi:MAG: response regulator, partial [Deltaproteobacteria bacterium]|nr:response regulator [Deltaproteobacteria bacterium]